MSALRPTGCSHGTNCTQTDTLVLPRRGLGANTGPGGQGYYLLGTRVRFATDQDRAHGCRAGGPQAGRHYSAWCAQNGWCCCAAAECSAQSGPVCLCAHSSDCMAPTHQRPICQGRVTHSQAPMASVDRGKASCSPEHDFLILTKVPLPYPGPADKEPYACPLLQALWGWP